MAENEYGYFTEKGSLSPRFFGLSWGSSSAFLLISLQLDYPQFNLTS